MVLIKEVLTGSAADRSGVKRGDYLVRINGKDINDVLDYRYYITEPRVRLLIHRGPELFNVVIRKPRYDDIGLEFETFLMDEKRSCRNKCIFCFIDQLPPGMRDALYFKDDDSRLSFLMGNYITLTNMDEHDISRIIDMKMSPINISVHTTNPELRCQMLSNRFAGSCYETMKRFAEAEIEMHCQIVLCKGVNDGAELLRSMQDLAALYPAVSSVSVVPAGITKYREKLYPLTPFTKEECRNVIAQVEGFAEECRARYGSRIFFCADEFYVSGEAKIPSGKSYEGYPQIENGVGMIRSMADEFAAAMKRIEDLDPHRPRSFSIATGVAAYGFIQLMVEEMKKHCYNLEGEVYEIKNEFFGETITVAGLITGRDLYRQLHGKPLGKVLFLPSVMLRHEKDRFLDDTTPAWLEHKLNVRIVFLDNDGYDFVETILKLS
ncbi:MAG: DUF512 domain-containing protein [Ruminococcaceae bacterium]|nr:DUF512 domain-containing protein [Oscillospiraceae bacterium]